MTFSDPRQWLAATIFFAAPYLAVALGWPPHPTTWSIAITHLLNRGT